jgi:hypothetical protein
LSKPENLGLTVLPCPDTIQHLLLLQDVHEHVQSFGHVELNNVHEHPEELSILTSTTTAADLSSRR